MQNFLLVYSTSVGAYVHTAHAMPQATGDVHTVIWKILHSFPGFKVGGQMIGVEEA